MYSIRIHYRRLLVNVSKKKTAVTGTFHNIKGLNIYLLTWGLLSYLLTEKERLDLLLKKSVVYTQTIFSDICSFTLQVHTNLENIYSCGVQMDLVIIHKPYFFVILSVHHTHRITLLCPLLWCTVRESLSYNFTQVRSAGMSSSKASCAPDDY